MTENMIDFGQSSEPKYSLRGFLNKQETAMPIAQDIAQAITVTHNAYKAYSAVEDEAQQAKYYNANIEYRNNNIKYQEELQAAGYDLGKQREVIDKHKGAALALRNKYELNDKYSSTIISTIENDFAKEESIYRSKYNEQQKAVALDNVQYEVANTISLPIDKVSGILSESKKTLESYGFTPRQASTALAASYINAKTASVDKESITFEQAGQLKKDIEQSLSSFDPKIITSTEYRQAMEKADAIKEDTRKKRETKLHDSIEGADGVPPKEIAKWVQAEVSAGIITPEKGSAYIHKATNAYTSEIATRQSREETKDNKEMLRTFYEAEYNNMKPEEFDKVIKAKAVELGIDARDAMHLSSKYRDPIQKQIMAKQKTEASRVLNELEYNNDGTDATGRKYTPKEYSNLLNSAHPDGNIPAEAYKKAAVFTASYNLNDSPELVSSLSAINLDSKTKEAYTAASNTYIKNNIAAALSGDTRAVKTISNLMTNYNASGEVSKTFTKMLSNVDTTTPEGLSNLTNNMNKIKEFISINPKLTDDMLSGDSKKKFMLYSAALLPDDKGNTFITASEAKKVEEILSGKLELSGTAKTDANKIFSKDYIGDSSTWNSDYNLYTSLLLMGTKSSDAIKQVNSKNLALSGDNYSLIGVDTKDPAFTGIESAIKELSGQIKMGDEKAYITVKNGNLMYGTKDIPNQYSLNIPIKSTKDANGKYVAGLVEINDVYAIMKAEGKRKEVTNAPLYTKGFDKAMYNIKDALEYAYDTIPTEAVYKVRHIPERVAATIEYLGYDKAIKEGLAPFKKAFVDFDKLMKQESVDGITYTTEGVKGYGKK